MDDCKILANFINEIANLYSKASPNSSLIFRGHGSSSFNLLPGIYRNDNLEDEFDSAHKIQIEHPNEFKHREHFSNLSKMQHFGLRTRLLDFTFNPLIALYIACLPVDDKTLNKDGEVIILQIPNNEIKHHYSDTVLCLSCLPYLKSNEKDDLRKFCLSKRGGVLDELDYKRNLFVHHLYHEIRSEYSTFDFEIKTDDLLTSHFVSPNKDNEREKIQNGLFAIYGLDKDISKKKVDEFVIKRIKIRHEVKSQILNMLSHFGIDDSVIYPGLERTTLNIYHQIFVKKNLDK